jgi:hypothetical protein
MKKYRMEITNENGTDNVSIEGTVKIEKYSPLEIGLRLGKNLFLVVGDNLSMPVFAEKVLKISGNISRIEKSDLKEKRN